MADIPSRPSQSWTELSTGKEQSRLLYTSPVCFLCTTATTSEPPAAKRNVMVLTWLTATNNEGRFLFSLNKRRYTASQLKESDIFSLSVPIRGMEDLVRNVGSVSGRHGSKFPADHDAVRDEPVPTQNEVIVPLSKRQKKKVPRFVQGIPGLRTVPFRDNVCNTHTLFCIEGTIAHLQCQVVSILGGTHVIDEEHLLVSAQVTAACVDKNYWDASKNLFRPCGSHVQPYLTFFGSQTFGYVVGQEMFECEADDNEVRLAC